MAEPDRRDLLDRRLRPRGGPVGRRDAVEVPRRRLGRAVGRAGCRRRRDPGVREPALRPRRARAPARAARARPRRSRRSPRPTRAASTASSASSTRHGGSASFTGRRVLRLGRRADRPVLRRAGEHPRRRGDRRCARDDLHRDGGQAARASGCSSASPPRRPRAATGAASSRRRCSSSSATAATPALSDVLVDLRVDDHAQPVAELARLYGAPRPPLRQDAPRGAGSPSTTTLRAELGERLGRARLRRRPRPGARRLGGHGEPRGARRRRRAARSGRAAGAPRAMSDDAGYEILSIDDLDRYTTRPGVAGAAAVAPADRLPAVRRQRLGRRRRQATT